MPKIKNTTRIPTENGEPTQKPRTVESEKKLSIPPPNMRRLTFHVVGTSAYAQQRFSEKARREIEEKQAKGEQARKGKKRVARQFDADYEAAKHVSTEGWIGIPCAAFRHAMIRACKLCGFAMTDAKITLFVMPDGQDRVDGTPLTRIYGEPEKWMAHARNKGSGGCDLRIRPRWSKWEAHIRVMFDADWFSDEDVTNLLARAGLQIGVGEGRYDSKESYGMGMGCFDVLTVAGKQVPTSAKDEKQKITSQKQA